MCIYNNSLLHGHGYDTHHVHICVGSLLHSMSIGFQYLNSFFKHYHPITLHFNALNTNHTCFRTKVCPVVASTQWSTFPNDPEPRLILIANCSLSTKQPSSATKPYNNNTRLMFSFTQSTCICYFLL